MGPDVVVLAEPLVDDDVGLPGGGEPFSIQDFPAKGSIEAFVIAIFPCAARQASEAPPRGASPDISGWAERRHRRAIS